MSYADKCGNCEHVEDGSCSVIGCIGFDLWHPIRSCENCYSKNSNKYDEPCISCSCRDRWQLAEVDLNAVEYSAKADSGKPRPTLVPPSLIKAVAVIRGYGAEKYGSDDNWRKVEPQRYKDALYRHWLAYLEGEVNDPESGLPHIWHCACNIAFLIEMEGEK